MSWENYSPAAIIQRKTKGYCDGIFNNSNHFHFAVSRRRMSRSMSPTREVAPKLVMGSKKYGRRSRPQFNEKSEASQSEGEEEQSQSEEEEEEEDQDQIEGQGTNKVHRSASQTDVKRRRQPQVASSKLKRCASLPARRNMAREFVRIRGSSPTASNKNVKAPLDSSVESLGKFPSFSAQFFGSLCSPLSFGLFSIRLTNNRRKLSGYLVKNHGKLTNYLPLALTNN